MRCGRHSWSREKYTQPGSNWRPSACQADVIATRPWVLLMLLFLAIISCSNREALVGCWSHSLAMASNVGIPRIRSRLRMAG